MALFHNVGVCGGALCYAVTDAQSIVVGCSGGVYALLGMHLGDLLMNWSEKVYRWPVVCLLVTLALFDFFAYLLAKLADDGQSVSHSAHIGGYIAGSICVILMGRNLVVKWHEQVSRVLALVFAFSLTTFAVWWNANMWPPRSIFEELGI